MKVNSYVVSRDYGFAPNPFHGFCTLATCKSRIRKRAEIGDWVIGTGGVAIKRSGELIFAMKVTETMTFQDYWEDPRFSIKKPRFDSGRSLAYGDNIYFKYDNTGAWQQINSHHSYPDGRFGLENLETDTGVDRVLISEEFVYFGVNAPVIPPHLRDARDMDLVCDRQGDKVNFSPEHVSETIDWIDGLGETGVVGKPVWFHRQP